jgi:hypothetical protein
VSALAPAADHELLRSAAAINPVVLNKGLLALEHARELGQIKRDDVMVLIDYSRPSTEPRLWVLDLKNNRVLFEELVAHGKNTGGNYARRFSNTSGSLMSSLGAFTTMNTYYGSNGYSLRLKGLEPGINDQSVERAIVMHGADYVNPEIGKKLGRLGRSWGCPAVRQEVAREIIDTIQGGALVFSWYPDAAS